MLQSRAVLGLLSTGSPCAGAVAALTLRFSSTQAKPPASQGDEKQQKKGSLVEPLYFYSSPGSSLKEPSYGVSVSDPVYFYDSGPSPSKYASTVIVSNPARQPYTQTTTFNRKPSNSAPRYMISLSDPVYKTENDAKDGY